MTDVFDILQFRYVWVVQDWTALPVMVFDDEAEARAYIEKDTSRTLRQVPLKKGDNR